LEEFGRLAAAAVSYHPDSKAARAAGRLAYLAAAIVCESLDYVSVHAAFRTAEERREVMLNAVRLGALSDEQGQQTLKLAIALVEKYAPGGKTTATAVESALRRDLEQIPAEIVADQAVRLLKSDQLFLAGRELEMACYHKALPAFDGLNTSTKSMLGALLDYARVERKRFAEAWTSASSVTSSDAPTQESNFQDNLFSDSL
jgi:hypothetical protein